MLRALSVLALSIPAAVFAQPAAPPRFEVASVKPSAADPSSPSSGLKTAHGRLTATNVTLKRCIVGAFGVGPNQVFGGPAWLDSGRFDIVAKAAQPIDDDAALMAMLQALLAERFQLRIRRETRIAEAFLLEIARNGPKLEPAEVPASSTSNAPGLIDAKAITMDRFAEVLSRQMDLPVVNHTALHGVFNLKLEWTPGSPAAADPGPSVFTAIGQQSACACGLRRRPSRCSSSPTSKNPPRTEPRWPARSSTV